MSSIRNLVYELPHKSPKSFKKLNYEILEKPLVLMKTKPNAQSPYPHPEINPQQ